MCVCEGVCMCVCMCVCVCVCVCARFVNLYEPIMFCMCAFFLPPPPPQAPLGYGDGGLSTTQELETCKRTVLSPYLYFLKLVSEVLGHDSFLFLGCPVPGCLVPGSSSCFVRA